MFSAADTDLSSGSGTFRLTGNTSSGWVALFLVVDGRRTPARPFMAPLQPVTPGLGYGDVRGEEGVWPIIAGAHDLRLLVLDKDDKAVSGLEVDALIPGTGRLQRAVTDPEGRVHFSGFENGEAMVSWRERREGEASQTGEVLADEFMVGDARLVTWVEDEEVTVRAARNPWVRIRVRIDGAPEDAWCPVRSPRVEGARGNGVAYEGSHGFYLPPGIWRGSADVVGAGDVPFETPALSPDQEATIEPRAAIPGSVPWLDVAFTISSPAEKTRVACAVEARNVLSVGGWMGTQAAAPHPHLVVPLLEGEYVVTGAILVGDDVRISDPQHLVVGKGDRVKLTLAATSAGGILAPPTPSAAWNDELELLELAFPGASAVEDEGFRFAWLSNRVRATTWWMPPGTYTLVRKSENGERSRVRLAVKPGRVVRVLEEAGTLRVAGE